MYSCQALSRPWKKDYFSKTNNCVHTSIRIEKNVHIYYSGIFGNCNIQLLFVITTNTFYTTEMSNAQVIIRSQKSIHLMPK